MTTHDRDRARCNILEQIPKFCVNMIAKLREIGIDVEPYELDHVCYRAESTEEYLQIKDFLLSKGDLLTETEIQSRLISTFKLSDHIIIDPIVPAKTVSVVELPMPKTGSFYRTGWEHCEFAVGNKVSLLDFAKNYPNIDWDESGMSKSNNPDIRVQFSDKEGSKTSVKFHKDPLEKVIALEKGISPKETNYSICNLLFLENKK